MNELAQPAAQRRQDRAGAAAAAPGPTGKAVPSRPVWPAGGGARRPFIVGIGGTVRQGSTSERALRVSLKAAEAAGAEILAFAGPELDLPMYVPDSAARTPATRRFVEALGRCDGLIIAAPVYHGSISGMIKNALDYVEDLRAGPRTYLEGVGIGCIACGAGWQGAGQTLAALRAIAHALRGWPTPLGGMLNSSSPLFDGEGRCLDRATELQLETIGEQVAEFACLRLFGAA